MLLKIINFIMRISVKHLELVYNSVPLLPQTINSIHLLDILSVLIGFLSNKVLKAIFFKLNIYFYFYKNFEKIWDKVVNVEVM